MEIAWVRTIIVSILFSSYSVVSLCDKAHADGILGKFLEAFEKANSSNNPKSSKSKKDKKDKSACKVSSEDGRVTVPATLIMDGYEVFKFGMGVDEIKKKTSCNLEDVVGAKGFVPGGGVLVCRDFSFDGQPAVARFAFVDGVLQGIRIIIPFDKKKLELLPEKYASRYGAPTFVSPKSDLEAWEKGEPDAEISFKYSNGIIKLFFINSESGKHDEISIVYTSEKLIQLIDAEEVREAKEGDSVTVFKILSNPLSMDTILQLMQFIPEKRLAKEDEHSGLQHGWLTPPAEWKTFYLAWKIRAYEKLKKCPFSEKDYYEEMRHIKNLMRGSVETLDNEKTLQGYDESVRKYVARVARCVKGASAMREHYYNNSSAVSNSIINFYIDDGEDVSSQVGAGCDCGPINKSDLIKISMPEFNLDREIDLYDLEKYKKASPYAKHERERIEKKSRDHRKAVELNPEFYLSWWDTRAQHAIEERGAGVFSDKDLFEEAIAIAQGDIRSSKINIKVAEEANRKPGKHTIDRHEALKKAYDTLIKTYNQRLEEDKYFDFKKYEVRIR